MASSPKAPSEEPFQKTSPVKRFLFRPSILPFLICAGGILLLFLLERYPFPLWTTVKGYFLSSPYVYHSLVLYLAALLLALFSYRNLYNVKILLAGILFLVTGFFSLLYLNDMPGALDALLPLRRDVRSHLLIYVFYSLGLLLVAVVPVCLPKLTTWSLLSLFVLCEAVSLLAGTRYLPPNWGERLTWLWQEPLLFLAGLNALIVLAAHALSAWRKDPYAWSITGYLVLFTVAYGCRGSDLEILLLHCVPVVLVLMVLTHMTASLSHRANYDPLTNIYSRRYCDNLLQGKGKHLGRRYALALFDLDRFKKVNDRYGHQMGDTVLFRVAQKIREKSLPRGIVCRYGGEEILVIFPRTRKGHAAAVARQIVASVSKMKIPVEGRKKPSFLKITVSGGLGAGRAGRNDTASVLEVADKALYRSKRRGRNRLTVAR